MKGIILHGGAGTRLRPLTFSGPKQLIPVANKPISRYVLEDLRSAGIKDVAIVLGETFPELVQQYYGDGSRFNVSIKYVFQGKPLGIAHAVSLCRDFVGEDSFILYLGDNLLQHGIRGYLENFVGGDYDAYILLKEVDDPTKFGVAKFDGKKLVALVEKPKVPPSKYALVGVYFFKPTVFDVIKDLRPSWRGELEITDALQLMLERGYNVGYSFVEGWWLDTGKKDDILYANSLILDEHIVREIFGTVVESKVEGRVSLGEGSKLVNSTVRGPAVIGRNCVIEDSFIGPYTSIGDNVSILNSSIEYSIILDNAIVRDVDRLEESLVGKNAKIFKNRVRNAVKLHVGDYSEIEL
ncbi:MAG: glucose-1-phosphate thymidylyltransferase [Nitrososphaeria archaeon]|nr:glucose-1-phosphate thymidylyltransferase [Nitrososphaeria archaeon]